MSSLEVLAPLRIESIAFGGADTIIGTGRDRAQRSGVKLAGRLDDSTAVALVGVAGALDPQLVPGDLIVANELRSGDSSSRYLPGAALLSAEIRRSGCVVHTGPLLTTTKYVSSSERAGLAASGAIAVDMESYWVMGSLVNNPVAVVRAISDTATRGPALGGLRALRSISRARGPLERWARACGEHDVIRASPRPSCVGAQRWIDAIERALDQFGEFVYVLGSSIHDPHVVDGLKKKGAHFVERVEEVPDSAVVVLAAHGVSPELRRHVREREDLKVIEVTCAVFATVDNVVLAADALDDVVVVTDRSHPENFGHADLEGTFAVAPERIHVVASIEDVSRLDLDRSRPISFLTVASLSSDASVEITSALRARFPGITALSSHDVCVAAPQDHEAVRSMAHRCDLMVIVGSRDSSRSARLLEVAQHEGCRTELIDEVAQLELQWLADARTIGVTAGDSASNRALEAVVGAISSLGPMNLSEERYSAKDGAFRSSV
jgi:4-hydroxy-3-methylbut-2-enyl diphosphate reductase